MRAMPGDTATSQQQANELRREAVLRVILYRYLHYSVTQHTVTVEQYLIPGTCTVGYSTTQVSYRGEVLRSKMIGPAVRPRVRRERLSGRGTT